MARQIPVERLAELTRAVTTVISTTELHSMLRRLVEAACETTGARYAALGVIGEHKTLVEFVHTGIPVAKVRAIGHLPEGRGVLGTLIRDGETIRLDRISDHPDSVGFPENHPPMASFLGVPVGLRHNPYGNLYLTEKEGGFDADDESIVEALAAIAAAAIETARLRARLEEMAVAEDRQRIGRDLHDSIIQDLFGTGLQLQGIAANSTDEEIRSGLDSAVNRIDSTIDSLRRIVSALARPERAGSFSEMLRAQLTRIAEPYKISPGVSVEPPGLELSSDLADLVIPLATEAVSNALRHSGSDSVEVRFESLGDRLVLSVVDQGRGFDKDAIEAGMGLKNLRERAARLGGDAEIRSVPGVGTVVEVVIPYSG